MIFCVTTYVLLYVITFMCDQTTYYVVDFAVEIPI